MNLDNYPTTHTYYDSGIDITKALMIAWIVSCIGFMLIPLAIHTLISLVRRNCVVSVYVINILISDMLQVSCFAFLVLDEVIQANWISGLIYVIYNVGLQANIAFMVCVAVERYLVVAWPLWYRFKHSIKCSVVVSIIVWILSAIEFMFACIIGRIFQSIVLLLPFPVLFFCLVGTIFSLLLAISLTPIEKCRIIATLVCVLLTYSLLFLPWVISLLKDPYANPGLFMFSPFSQFSSLADLILYVFMTKGPVDKLLASLCCCRIRITGEEDQDQVATSNQKNAEEVNPV